MIVLWKSQLVPGKKQWSYTCSMTLRLIFFFHSVDVGVLSQNHHLILNTYLVVLLLPPIARLLA